MINGHADGGVVCDSNMDTGESTIAIAAGSHDARRCSDTYEPPQGKHWMIAQLSTTGENFAVFENNGAIGEELQRWG